MNATAVVEVFGKGFRVSAASEEFQRLVPSDASALREGLETKLQDYDQWATLLEPLYGLPERELAAQYCVLLSRDEIMALAFAPTEDRHKRPSVVVVAATSSISWNDLALADTFDRCVGLANRLAVDYAAVFKGNPARVGEQLSRGTFLRDRSLELRNEKSAASLGWPHVVQAIREWQGITGVSTVRLAGLGANIVVGTRHEAEKANGRGGIDGYYDVREQRIIPLAEKLKPWPKPTPALPKRPAATPSAEAPADNEDRLQSIDESLRGIDGSMRRLAETAEAVRQAFLDMWFPSRRDDKK